MIGAAHVLAVAAVAHPADLSPFNPLVGACWRADLSATVNDTHCFETLYGAAHVLDRHEVRDNGKTIYAGETIYSADGSQLVFTYVNSLGGVGHGTAHAEKSRLRFVGHMRGSPADAEQPLNSEWRLVDPDHYQVRSLIPSKGGHFEKPLAFTRVSGPLQK